MSARANMLRKLAVFIAENTDIELFRRKDCVASFILKLHT